MSMRATGTYAVTSWEEKTWEGRPWDEVPGVKQTHSIVGQAFRGGIEGEAVCQQLIAYCDDGTASYVGLVRVTGALGGRSGSFVLQGTGVYADGVARGTWAVVAGSATGELRGLRGQGEYVARQEEYPNVAYTLDYALEGAA